VVVSQDMIRDLTAESSWGHATDWYRGPDCCGWTCGVVCWDYSASARCETSWNRGRLTEKSDMFGTCSRL
jgi:hypothetical protein